MSFESFEDFLASLDPKVAKAVKVAAEVELKRLPVASTGLTEALGGGIGAGRNTLVYGPLSCGKSVLFMQSVAAWQKQGLICAWIDVEGTYEKSFAARLGINNDELILIQKRSAGAIEKAIKPLLKNKIDVIVIDSISAIMPDVFLDSDGSTKDYDDRKQTGAHAKAITRLISGIEYENEGTAIILISQVTTEIGQTYVKMIPHGGKRTLHACTQIIKLGSSNTENSQIKGVVWRGDIMLTEPVGREVEYYIEKNKIGPQSRKGKYDLHYAGDSIGIDAYGEVVDAAEKFGVIAKKGSWYTYNGQQIQGRAQVVELLRESDEMYESMKRELQIRLTGEVDA